MPRLSTTGQCPPPEPSPAAHHPRRSRHHRSLRPLHRLARAPGAALLGLALLAITVPAHADVLVSNIEQTDNGRYLLGPSGNHSVYAFSFEAGDDAVLTSIEFKLENLNSSAVTTIPTVTVHEGVVTGSSLTLGTVVAVLTGPASIAAGKADYTFTAPSDTTLAASTAYYVLFELATGAVGARAAAASASLDEDSLAGWSISGQRYFRSATSTGALSGGNFGSVLMRVNGTVVADTTAPTVSSAAVNGTSLVITFNENLAAANLANSAFTVKKTPQGGSETTVSLTGSPAISGATVTLTLAAAVVATDTGVKVSYTKPTSGTDNKLKDADDNEVASFTDQAVTNTTAPAVSSATVDGTSLVITFNENLAAAANLANSVFMVKKTPQGGSEETVSLTGSPAISGATVTLTLAAAVVATDGSIKVSYTKPGSGTDNKLKDADDNEVATFTDQAVTNNTAAVCAVPDFGTRRRFWTGTLTVAPITSGGDIRFYGFSGPSSSGALSPTSFGISQNSYVIDNLVVSTSTGVEGDLIFSLQTNSLTDAEVAALRLHVCAAPYDFSDASHNSVRHAYDWEESLDWSTIDSRTAYLSLPANNPATGEPTISGRAEVGATLTADASGIMDADGTSGVTFEYQWVRVDGTTDTDISGETGSTYTLGDDDVGKTVKFRVRFKDQLYVESYTANGVMVDSAPIEERTSAVHPSSGTVEAAKAPSLVSATFEGSLVKLLYDEPLDPASVPAASAYAVTVTVDGTAVAPTITVSSVAIADRTVTVTLSAAPDGNATVTLSYTVPSTTPVQDLIGNDAAAFSNQNVENPPAIRLVGGTTVPAGQQPYDGRVEIRYDGEWRSVCDDYWTDNNAHVVCRMAGHAQGSVVNDGQFLAGHFGNGNGEFWLDDVTCAGNEANILDCPRRRGIAVGTHNCRPGEEAGVRCRVGTYSVPIVERVFVNDRKASEHDDVETDEVGADGYTAGETLEVTLVWSEKVVVSTPSGAQVPKVAVDYSNAGFAIAAYSGGSGTKRTVFSHTLPGGSPANPTVKVYKNSYLVSGLRLRGSTITSQANPATKAELVHDGYPENASEVLPPGVRRTLVELLVQREASRRSMMPRTASSGWGGRSVAQAMQGQSVQPTIEVRLEFDRVVLVDTTGGTPTVGVLLAGGQERRAPYAEGSGTAVLVFRYTLAAGEQAPDPVQVVANSLALEGGTIRGEFGRDASLAHDGTEPVDPATVTGAPVIGEAGPDGQWTPGETVEVRVAFSASVEVDAGGGTPSIGVRLGGAEARTAAYLGDSGTTELAFGYTLVDSDGSHTSMRVPENSLALNGGTIRRGGVDASLAHEGAAKSAGPALPEGPTARFERLPQSNDGGTAFSFELHFSKEPDGMSWKTVAGGLLEVSGANVTKARRLNPPANQGWEVDVTPTHDGDVVITLPARACGEANAVCFDNGTTPLSEAATTTVPALPFEGSFAQAPPEHDGATPFELNFHLSAAPASLGWETVRDALFEVTGGSIETAWRLVRGSNLGWTIRVAPTDVGAVTVTLKATTDCNTPPGVCTASGRKLAGGIQEVVPGPASLSVADAAVDENAANASLAFVVTLSRARHEATTVAYATSDGTATADVDYTAASGTLTFTAGETEKTVSVPVLNDALDEGSETVTLTLSDPAPSAYVHLGDAEATGTINNTDPMPKAWLARFGRTVGSQVVEAVSERVDGSRSGSHLNVGGVSLGGGAPLDDDAHLAPGDWLARQMAEGPDASRPQERTLTGRDLLLGSSFHLVSQAGEDRGAVWSAWGRVSTGGFRAEVDGVTMDGDVVSGLLGVDAEWQRLLAGVLVLRSEAEGAYGMRDGGGSGSIDSTLTGVYPYARLRLGGRLSAWAVAGAGAGDLRLVQGTEVYDTGLEVRLGALGVRGTLAAVGGFDLALKSDVLWVHTASDAVPGLPSTSADVNRLRLILEGGRPWTLSSGAVLAPTVQVGLRHDGGDAETGTGVEVGAGFRYSAGMLSVDAQVRTLLAHEAGGYEEWGASGSIRLSPNASGLGPSLALLPSWGVAGSAAERLWAQPDASALVAGAAPAAGRVDAELSWGLAALHGRGVLTPYARLALAEGQDRSWHLGTRLALPESLDLSLEGSSRGGAAHDLTLRATVPW